MNFKIKLFTFIVIVSLLNSCKSDDENFVNLPINQLYQDYSASKVGNYWIYQHYKIDNNGISTPIEVFDSCFVEKDTTINSKKYSKLFRPNHNNLFPYNQFIRDSLHYIVNSRGEILFSSQDFQTVFYSHSDILNSNDTVCKSFFKMDNKNATTLTPAGTFITSNAKETQYFYSHNVITLTKTRNTLYAEKIGIVSESAFIFPMAMYNYERRLVRYSIK